MLHTPAVTSFSSSHQAVGIEVDPTDAAKIDDTSVLSPGQSFPKSAAGEFSMVTFNMLAPLYNSLDIESLEEREAFAQQDRETRLPLAIEMAKQTNADLLCLQEVEGGPQFEPRLQELLAENDGYDSYLWSPLLPKKPDHIVGLCFAWRSTKLKLEASDCYARGMVGQFQELSSGATFTVGNVHLPARPSNILGRLRSMSMTIHKVANYDSPRRNHPLDGLLVVCGDFNCEHDAAAARLLSTGKSPYGNIYDRNYRVNVAKSTAQAMKHGFLYKDVYQEARQEYAPVTVSLKGRAPGCMDQIFMAQSPQPPGRRIAPAKVLLPIGKKANCSRRQARRSKAVQLRRRDRRQWYATNGKNRPMKVESLLSTVIPSDKKRLETIQQGLPNIKEGFPSDHIPIGAMFVPNPDYNKDDEKVVEESTLKESPSPEKTPQFSRGGISSVARNRRQAALKSLSTRRRHNLVLRHVAEWLVEMDADLTRDSPLYKSPWSKGITDLKKKSRAPDLMGRVGSTIILVEVSVSAQADKVRGQKLKKYADVPEILQKHSTAAQEGSLQVHDRPFVIVLEESGKFPKETLEDIGLLAGLSKSAEPDQRAQRFVQHLQAMFSEETYS